MPTRYGYSWGRRRVPIYGTRRVRVGTRTVWRRRPRYTTKRVPDGFEVRRVTVPKYEWRNVQIGWDYEEKRLPRMVTKKVKVGSEVKWELVIAAPSSPPESTSPWQLGRAWRQLA